MSIPLKKDFGSASLIVVLAAIMAILGVLQYRSAQQVSDATARDMEESLQSALLDFRHGLEIELSALCLAMQSSRSHPDVMGPKEVARRLNHWRQTAIHPDLVTDAFLWEGDRGAEPIRVSLTGAAQRTPWPADLAGLPEHLKNVLLDWGVSPADGTDADGKSPRRLPFPLKADSNGIFRDGPSAGGHAPSSGSGWMIDQERLVLLHPIVTEGKQGPQHVVWLIVPLQREFFAQRLLPELIRRHFGGRSQNYQVAIIMDGISPAVLYSTEPGFGASHNAAVDARLNLFGPPVLVAENLSSHPAGVVIPTNSKPGGNQAPPFFIDPLEQSPQTPRLTVIARHRQGSLEAAVASLRERSLAVNFGVLGILALTLTLVVATSHRARGLAQMQMDFVAGVSHELRTPLTAILLAARNMEDGVVPKNGLARYGAAIENQAAQLSWLVDEILLFAETHSGHHIYKIEAFDIGLGIHNTLQSLAPLIDSSGFTIEQDVAPDLPLARGDVAAFSQCLQNLITNSLKYGGEKRWAGVRAFVTERDGKKEICVSVEDRGLGIGNSEIKRIFQPFYRSPQVVAAQIHGNGLGLPLTKTMVEAMGGQLTVASQPNEGSTFTIHLRPAAGAA